ncbi:hypothetical protein [Lapidilactobacillus gannanensis]|uniref:Uncharacterized protein n=1 Tax=Lapidilactobacillus gannanensis TaxID=2486002 RepID=A0ABW4BK20_9LACO|nr:hypothetical protein [Lapidilactobacillus gannanensis]
MEFDEAQAFDYSVFCVNEIIEYRKLEMKPFKTVWQTSLGIAEGSTVKYSDSKYPVLVLNTDNEYYGRYISSLQEDTDVFALVRHAVYDYFSKGIFSERLKVVEQPNLLLDKLLELSRVEITENIRVPEYSTMWNFKSLQNQLELDFIDKIEIMNPISLVSQN